MKMFSRDNHKTPYRLNSHDIKAFIKDCQSHWNIEIQMDKIQNYLYDLDHNDNIIEIIPKMKEFKKKILTNPNLLSDDNTIFLFKNIFKNTELTAYKGNGERFIQLTKEFIKEAQSFNPPFNSLEIYQGLRNLWIIFFIQYLCGQKLELTGSAKSYSFLYPLTDNYLDNSDNTEIDKIKLCRDISRKIKKKINIKFSQKFQQIYYQLEQIQLENNEKDYENIQESLLQINKAQRISFSKYITNKEQLVKLSIFKGGSSVVADGFITNPFLNKNEVKTLFMFGGALQFLDDINDITKDRLEKNCSIFSQSSPKLNSYYAFQLIWFIIQLMDRNHWTPFPHYSKELQNFMADSMVVLLINGIYHNKKYFDSSLFLYLNKNISNISTLLY